MFGFFVQESPTKLETPLVIGFCYVSSIDLPASLLRFADATCYVWYQGVSCCPDKGADPRQHVGGLNKYIYRSNPVLSTSLHSWQAFIKNSLTLLQDIFKIFQQARGLHVYTSSRNDYIYFYTSF